MLSVDGELNSLYFVSRVLGFHRGAFCNLFLVFDVFCLLASRGADTPSYDREQPNSEHAALPGLSRTRHSQPTQPVQPVQPAQPDKPGISIIVS